MKKQDIADLLYNIMGEDTAFGNEFVNMADAWADRVTDKLRKMKKKELQELLIKAQTLECYNRQLEQFNETAK